MAASETGLVTQGDVVLQVQFEVSSPESLMGLQEVAGLSHAVSSAWEDTATSRHPLEWAWRMLVPQMGRQPQVCQVWHRESVIWLLCIKYY